MVFLGRSNVGKSSLLNALLNYKNLAYTSSKPGRTRLMNAFSIARGTMVLLDMPGYGHASREEWGVQIMKYLKSRKQYVLHYHSEFRADTKALSVGSVVPSSS